MKILRLLAAIILVCIVATLFAACDFSSAETEPPTETESTTETQKATKKPSSNKNPTVKYDDEAPTRPAELPDFNGKDFDYSNIYLGEESEMRVVDEATIEGYTQYLSALEESGYTFYTDNTIGNNRYATYINDTHIINVMYIDAFKQVRVISDDRAIFSLPGLKEENIYDTTEEGALILLSDDKVAWPGRMGYVYQLADGSFFIIDGGWSDLNNPHLSSATTLMAVLEEYAPDPENIKIAAWLITHQHTDHMGAMYDISQKEEYRSKISVEKIIYNAPSEEDLAEQDKTTTSNMIAAGRKTKTAIKSLKPEAIVKAHPGQVFYIRDLSFTVYTSHDLLLYSPWLGFSHLGGIRTHNDTCVVTKVEYKGKTALYLADSHSIANTNVVAPVYNTSLDADIVQVAHHGYGDTSAGNIYEHITPEMVFWPVMRGHFDGKNPDDSIYYEKGSAYNGVANVGFNSSLFAEGIKHFVFTNNICIVIDDFENWDGHEWDALPNE